MKTVFDKATRDELIKRIHSLNENSKAFWGKMNIYQMLKHCTLWDEMVVNNKTYNRVFIGRLLGKLLLKSAIRDGNALRQNTPTIPELVIKEDGNVASQKSKWISQIEAYTHFSNPGFIHPFFGKMTKEQIGIFAYKHSDHHLKQFNA